MVALAWLLHHPAVTAPIVGPRTLDQLTGALRALEVTLRTGRLSDGWTRSSRARAAQGPRPTPGNRARPARPCA